MENNEIMNEGNHIGAGATVAIVAGVTLAVGAGVVLAKKLAKAYKAKNELHKPDQADVVTK